MKKTNTTIIIIMITIIAIIIMFLIVFNAITWERCKKFGSYEIHSYNPESCYAAGCKPDSQGGEWGCIPKFGR